MGVSPGGFAGAFSSRKKNISVQAPGGQAGSPEMRSPVQEGHENREQEVGPGHNVVMGGGGQDGEPGGDEVLTIPAGVPQPPAEEIEKGDRVGGRQTIGIAGDNQRGDLQSGNALRPIVVLAQSLPHAENQAREIFRLGSETQVVLVDGSVHKELGGEGGHPRLHFWMPAGPFERRGDQHEPLDKFWMANGGLQSHGAAQGEAQQGGLSQSKLPDQAGDIVGHVLETDGAIRERRTPVPIQVNPDDLVFLGQRGRERGEHLKGAKAAVQHDQRLPGSMYLVVQRDPVDSSVRSRRVVRSRRHEYFLLTSLVCYNSLCYKYILIVRRQSGKPGRTPHGKGGSGVERGWAPGARPPGSPAGLFSGRVTFPPLLPALSDTQDD